MKDIPPPFLIARAIIAILASGVFLAHFVLDRLPLDIVRLQILGLFIGILLGMDRLIELLLQGNQ